MRFSDGNRVYDREVFGAPENRLVLLQIMDNGIALLNL
jgi:hypothetical protein